MVTAAPVAQANQSLLAIPFISHKMWIKDTAVCALDDGNLEVLGTSKVKLGLFISPIKKRAKTSVL